MENGLKFIHCKALGFNRENIRFILWTLFQSSSSFLHFSFFFLFGADNCYVMNDQQRQAQYGESSTLLYIFFNRFWYSAWEEYSIYIFNLSYKILIFNILFHTHLIFNKRRIFNNVWYSTLFYTHCVFNMRRIFQTKGHSLQFPSSSSLPIFSLLAVFNPAVLPDFSSPRVSRENVKDLGLVGFNRLKSIFRAFSPGNCTCFSVLLWLSPLWLFSSLKLPVVLSSNQTWFLLLGRLRCAEPGVVKARHCRGLGTPK